MRLKDTLEGLTCVVHRDVPATGVISYGQTHEPHCEACCKHWTVVMQHERPWPLTIDHLRSWQDIMRATT